MAVPQTGCLGIAAAIIGPPGTGENIYASPAYPVDSPSQRNENELALALEKLATDRALCKRLSEAAKESALSRFSYRFQWEQIEKILEQEIKK